MTFNLNAKLIKAVREDDQEKVFHYLIRDANVRQRVSKYGENLLHIADSAFVIKTLLRFGAKVNAKDSLRRTALHTAIEKKKDIEVINELLKAGANVNAKALSGDYCNMYHGRGLEALYEFLVYGMDLTVRNKIRGQFPLHYACRYAPYNIDKQVEVVRALLHYGADVNATDDWGDSALHTAIYEEAHSGVLEVLLEYGADITIKGLHPSTTVPNSFTPLDAALRYNDVFSAKRMIKMTLINKMEDDWRKIVDLPKSVGLMRYGELLSYLNDCLFEIERMKHDVVCGKNPLYFQVKRKIGSTKPMYLYNPNFEKEISIKYSIYNDIILTRVKPCILRAKLLDALNTLDFPNLEGKRVFQNSYCLRQIADNLSNEDLSNFISAFKNISVYSY